MEKLSGFGMSDVNVHYDSAQTAQLNAFAYAQGSDIHLAPAQEKHLPHEAWHIVQQKQGRVKPTLQMKGNVNVDDDVELEKEADRMGAKALSAGAEKTDLQLKQDQFSPLVSFRTQASMAPVAQLRAKNPYEQAGAHEGYELTAHHIVPHSKLSLALTLLNNYDNACTGPKLGTSVLMSSIPATLTKDSVINIAIFQAQDKAAIETEWLDIIQKLLKGTKTVADIASDKATTLTNGKLELTSTINTSVKLELDNTMSLINNNKFDDLRSSFYEWQGGNQFMGPSTDLREEPGNKDEIDFDAQWITAMSTGDFEKLTGLTQVKHKKVSKPDTSTDIDKTGGNGLGLQLIDKLGSFDDNYVPSSTIANEIKTILEGILAITRDVTPAAFDSAKWKEVTDISEFEKLENDQPFATKTKKWGRKGKSVTEHAFFRLKLSDIASLPEVTKNTTGSDSNTQYDYLKTPIPGSKQKGTQIYLPVKDARSIKGAPVKTLSTSYAALRAEGVIAESDTEVEIDDTNVKLAFTTAGGLNRKFILQGYTGDQVFVDRLNGKFKINKDKLNKIWSKTIPNPITDSLYDFCKKNHPKISLSTYMPKGLHDFLGT